MFQLSNIKIINSLKKKKKALSGDLRRTIPLRAHIRGGVPFSLRGPTWFSFSGGLQKQQQAPVSLFTELYTRKKNENVSVIKRLLKAYGYSVTHEKFSQAAGILVTYSSRNKKVRMTQYLLDITALLLSHMSEEQTFFMLAAIFEDLLPEYVECKRIQGG